MGVNVAEQVSLLIGSQSSFRGDVVIMFEGSQLFVNVILFDIVTSQTSRSQNEVTLLEKPVVVEFGDLGILRILVILFYDVTFSNSDFFCRGCRLDVLG
jgi:hypothetical protein